MGREKELVDRGHRLQARSRPRPGWRRLARRSPGCTRRPRRWGPARRRAGATAPPPRRGADRTRRRRRRRARGRAAAGGRGRVPPPTRAGAPACAGRRLRAPEGRRRPPRRRARLPARRCAARRARTPAKRSSTRLGLPSASSTRAASASSPACVACRKPPAGGSTTAWPTAMAAGVRAEMTSPWMDSRARPRRSAKVTRSVFSRGEAGPCPRRSTSSPPCVAVTWISSGLALLAQASARASATAGARSSSGASNGQAGMGTRSCVRAAMKPTAMRLRPSASAMRREWKVDAPPACAMRLDERRERDGEARLPQRRGRLLRLPGRVGGRREVLHGAAAADRRRAGRAAATRSGEAVSTLDEPPAAVLDLGRHGLALERIGHEHGAVGREGDAVALLPEARRWSGAQAWAGSAAKAPRRAPIRNSRLPSPPATGEGVDAVAAPAERADELLHAGADGAMDRRVLHQPLADMRAARLELGLDQRHHGGVRSGER